MVDYSAVRGQQVADTAAALILRLTANTVEDLQWLNMRFLRTDGKPIRIFSQGMPMQSGEQNDFTYTLNYVQNIHHLIKKDYPYYWIRLSYGSEKQFVQTFHSRTKENVKNDLLSSREKEVLKLIAEDWDTKEIAKSLFISTNTVGNHRSNMIERLGVRDSTALVQLAKMCGMI